MAKVATARVVKIGNSQGIRIPRPLLQQLGIEDEVELRVEDGQLCIRPKSHARAGWAEQFEAMAERGGDRLIDGDWPAPRFDEEEWEW